MGKVLCEVGTSNAVAEASENPIVARYSIVTVSRTPTILTLTVTPQ